MLGSTVVTHHNHWRRRYKRPDTAVSIGLAAVKLLSSDPKKRKRQIGEARRLQDELQRRTGFTGGNAEMGHAVKHALLEMGYSETVASYAGHLCAISGCHNFQGNVRISKVMRRHLRTIQRCRALLEADGLLRSHLLEPGDILDGMRAPVTHAQVVRDVGALQRLANNRTNERRTPHKRSPSKKNAAPAPAPAPAPFEPISAEQLDKVAADAPDWLSPTISDLAESKRKQANRSGASRSRSAADQPKPIDMWTPDEGSHRGRMTAAEIDQHLARMAQRRPVTEQETPAPTDEEMDALDLELQRATEQGLLEQQPPDRPPPLH